MPHPALAPWEKKLRWAAKSWVLAGPMTALEWYACAARWEAPISQVLATKAGLDSGVKQVWMATPYTAMVAQQTVRIVPSTQLEWNADDAQWLCGLITPLLEEVGFSLHMVGSAMVAGCKRVLEAMPKGFAEIDGGLLPDRFPDGRDGGRLVRLMAEIQMLLVAQPSKKRQEAGKLPIHGLWFWAPGLWPAAIEVSWPTVASSDSVLATLTDGREAGIAIIAADRINEGMARWRLAPRYWILGGGGYAVRLQRSVFPKFSRDPWRPGKAQDFASLMTGFV